MRRSRLSAWGAALLAGLLVAGCFGGSSDDGGGAAPTGSLPPDAGDPQPGGIFNWNTTTEPPTLDPTKSASALTQLAVSGLVYSKLLEFKTGRETPYGSMIVQADLAEEWSHSDDATTWTFNLREGVKFHNKAPVNGRELTSADVLCTVDRIKNLPGVQKSLLDVVDTATAPDDYTVVFTLKEPYAAFDETVANYYISILPCEGTRGEFDMGTQPDRHRPVCPGELDPRRPEDLHQEPGLLHRGQALHRRHQDGHHEGPGGAGGGVPRR